ncbi:hypothetical protein GOP47_0027018 [Adiantum capillus-veneris]|nr:hypothetical protein GOP47_0027018 [Adiantum capillus-veneris]
MDQSRGVSMISIAAVILAAMSSTGAWAQFAASPPSTGGGGYAPQQCNSVLLAFTSCLPSLASMVARGSGSPGAQNILGFAPSSTCCSSLRTIDPTCFCTLLAQAQKFLGGPTTPGAPDVTDGITAAAYQLPSLCKLRAEFVPLE